MIVNRTLFSLTKQCMQKSDNSTGVTSEMKVFRKSVTQFNELVLIRMSMVDVGKFNEGSIFFLDNAIELGVQLHKFLNKLA